MNAPGNGDAPADPIGWARHKLGAPADDGDRLRGFLARRLAEEDFAVSDEFRAALMTLSAGRTEAGECAPPREYLEDRAREVDAQIDAFAQSFFTLPVEQRNARWQSFLDRNSLTPPQRLRLRGLVPALEIEVPPPAAEPDRVDELSQLIRKLFVLLPPHRARLWRRERERLQSDIVEWSRAAGDLKLQQPEVADLLPHLVDELVQLDPDWQLRAETRAHRLISNLNQEAGSSKPVDPTGWESTFRAGLFVACVAVVTIMVSAFREQDRHLDVLDQDSSWKHQPVIKLPLESEPQFDFEPPEKSAAQESKSSRRRFPQMVPDDDDGRPGEGDSSGKPNSSLIRKLLKQRRNERRNARP